VSKMFVLNHCLHPYILYAMSSKDLASAQPNQASSFNLPSKLAEHSTRTSTQYL